VIAGSSAVANTPSSGTKGGIKRCLGDAFPWADGSVSDRKKSCIATMGSLGVLGNQADDMVPASSKARLCRGGKYCTGARGGQY